jgi:glutamate synthase domain-containing protein 2
VNDQRTQVDGFPVLRESRIWSRAVIDDIQVKAQLGRYRIQGFSTYRRVPCFEDLTFVPCTLSRVPLEGYRERCETKTVLGTRFAANPVVLDRPITIAGMSFGALSARAKTALGRAAKRAGISTTTGDGGMCPEEREAVDIMVYQVLPSRYGFNPDHLKIAQAVEIVIGQGAKPGTGGLLLGSKVSDLIAEQRTLPPGVDQRSPVRHPDFIGPDDLQLKIEELREATDWQVPIYVKMGATRVADDVKLAVKAGADVLVIDGMEGGTGASPEGLLDHTGIPTMSALCEAVRALEEIGALGEVQIIISGGIRDGFDAAKALALGADAVSIGTAALIALNCNAPLYVEDYERLGTKPGFCHHCHTGRCPVGITTQDPELMERLDVDEGTDRVFNFLQAMTMEMQMIARACGKSDVHHLEAEDLRALTLEASLITGIPLAGMQRGLLDEIAAHVADALRAERAGEPVA